MEPDWDDDDDDDELLALEAEEEQTRFQSFESAAAINADSRLEAIEEFIYPLAATRIQAQIRGFLERRKIEEKLEVEDSAVRLIQQVGRGFASRVRFYRQANEDRQQVLVNWWRRHKSAIPPSLFSDTLRPGDCRSPSSASSPNVNGTNEEDFPSSGDGAAASSTMNVRLTAVLILQRFTRLILARQAMNARQQLWIQVHDAAVSIQKIARRMFVRNKFGPILREMKWERQEGQLASFLQRVVKAPRLRRQNRRSEENSLERLICRMMIDQGMTIDEAKQAVKRNEARYGVKVEEEESLLYSGHLPNREWKHADFCNRRMLVTLNDESSDSEDVLIDEEVDREQMAPIKRPVFKPRKEIEYNYFTTPLLQVDKTMEKKMHEEEDKQKAVEELEIAEHVKAFRRKKRAAARLKKKRQEEEEDRSTNASLRSSQARRAKVFNRLAYGDMY